MPPQRLSWIDACKAFAIALVVLGHVHAGMADAGLLPHKEWIWLVSNSIYLLHMPLFMFLSGLTFSSSKDNWPTWTTKIFKNIVLPYFIWSWVQIGLKLIGAGAVNTAASPADFLTIIYQPISPFWFLYALLILQLVSRLIVPAFGIYTLLALAALAFGLHFSFPAGPQITHDAATFLVFFTLGQWSKLTNFVDRLVQLPSLVSIIAILLIMAVAAQANIDFYTAPGRLLGVPLVVLTVAIFARNAASRGLNAAPVQYIGRNVMAIFCLHIIFTSITRIALLKAGLTLASVHLIAGFSAGMVFPLLSVEIFRRLGLADWLGFGGSASNKIPRLWRGFKSNV